MMSGIKTLSIFFNLKNAFSQFYTFFVWKCGYFSTFNSSLYSMYF